MDPPCHDLKKFEGSDWAAKEGICGALRRAWMVALDRDYEARPRQGGLLGDKGLSLLERFVSRQRR